MIALTLLSTLVTLRVHVEPTSKVLCLLHFGGILMNLWPRPMPCEASSQTVFFHMRIE